MTAVPLAAHPAAVHNHLMVAAGVSVEGGQLYVAAASNADCFPQLTACSTRRIGPNEALPDAVRLVDLTHRVEQTLREFAADSVTVLQTRKYSGLTLTDAQTRLTAVCAVMAASVAATIPFAIVKTTDVGKLLDVDPKALAAVEPSLFGLSEPPAYWAAGMAKAFATVAYALRPGTSPKSNGRMTPATTGVQAGV